MTKPIFLKILMNGNKWARIRLDAISAYIPAYDGKHTTIFLYGEDNGFLTTTEPPEYFDQFFSFISLPDQPDQPSETT